MNEGRYEGGRRITSNGEKMRGRNPKEDYDLAGSFEAFDMIGM